jgi:hypothetical protein
MKLKLREFALVRDANGQLIEDGNNGGSGFKTAAKVGLGAAGVAGGAVLGTRWYHANKAYQAEGGIGKVYGDVKKMYAAGDSKGLQNLHGRLSSNAQASARAGWMGKLGKVGNVLTKFSANLKPALRELAARSGRIVEFGDGEANEAVIAALKAAASADESPAQRAMLLKQGLIEMVKGQVVINERGYDMMKKAGVPPKLTPEERREEIMGTEEEKRLSRFNHGGHGGHGVEFARGDYAIPALKNALKRGIGNGGDAISIHEIGVSGSAVPSLRGNAGNVRRALNKFWESPHSMKEATGLMKGTRKWAAQTIRDARKEGFGRSDRLSSHLGRLDRIYGIKDSGVA